MKLYNLSCVVGVSAFTRVKANSPEEAIEIASERSIELYFNGSGADPDEVWCIEEADGDPSNVTANEDEESWQ